MTTDIEDRSSDSTLFFSNAAITLLVGNITNYGLVLYAHELASSRSYAGLVYFSTFAGSTIFTLYAGSLLDRLNRYHLVLAFQPVYVLTLATLAWLSELPSAQSVLLKGLPVLAFVNGISLAFLLPGRFALLAMILGHRRLGAGTIVLNIIMMASFGIAPFVYGILRSVLGWPMLFASLASLYAVGGVLLLGQRTYLEVPANQDLEPMRTNTGFREMRAAWQASPTLGALLLLNVCGQVVLGPIVVLLPQFAQSIFGLNEMQRGIAMASVGLGLISGGLAARQISALGHRGPLLLASLAAIGATLSCLPLAFHISTFLVMLLFLGLAAGLFATLVPSLIQTLAPSELRGRILSLYSLACQVSPALSGLACGFIADAAGVKAAVFACGVLILGSAVIFISRSSALRSYG